MCGGLRIQMCAKDSVGRPEFPETGELDVLPWMASDQQTSKGQGRKANPGALNEWTPDGFISPGWERHELPVFSFAGSLPTVRTSSCHVEVSSRTRR